MRSAPQRHRWVPAVAVTTALALPWRPPLAGGPTSDLVRFQGGAGV